MSIVFSKLVRQSDIQLQDKTISPSTSTQEVTPDQQYYGLSKVTVNPMNLQEKSFSLSSNGVTRITPDDGYDGISAINLSANISGGGNSDEYINMIRGMMNLSYVQGSGGLGGINKFSITPDIFPSDTHSANLWLECNPNITSIEIPESINFVNFTARSCNSLKYVEIYNSSMELDFSYCNELRYANLPKATSISYSPFSSSALNHIRIPQVYSLESGAFNSCSGLKVIDFRGKTDSHIPSVSSTNDFYGVPSDCKVVIPDELYDAWTNWGTENRSPWYSVSQTLRYVRESEYATDGLTYELYSGGSSPDNYCTGYGTATDLDITIAAFPPGEYGTGYPTTMIKSNAFRENTDILHITMPSTITSIEAEAFSGCTSLKSIDFSKATRVVPQLDSDNAFYNVPKTCKFIIPSNLYDSWIASPGWNTLHNEGYNFVRAN